MFRHQTQFTQWTHNDIQLGDNKIDMMLWHVNSFVMYENNNYVIVADWYWDLNVLVHALNRCLFLFSLLATIADVIWDSSISVYYNCKTSVYNLFVLPLSHHHLNLTSLTILQMIFRIKSCLYGFCLCNAK